MPRIWNRKAVAPLLAATLAFLAGCAGPQLAATANFQRPADPCRKYETPTDFGRCHLFTSADGWRYIPEIGRSADLDTQLHCAPARPDLDVYAECIGRALAAAAARDAGAVEPAAGPGSRAPSGVEPIAPDVAVGRTGPAYSPGSLEELDAALRTWTLPRVESTPSAAVARRSPNGPTAAEPE